MNKNNIDLIEKELKKGKKMVAMLAPSFAAEFNYPEIISILKKLGFDKVVELTFGAKMINRDYHKILESSKGFFIASVCPGIVKLVNIKYPKYTKNIIKVDSPMIATAKICKKIFPKHKTIFMAPCEFKKQEAEDSKYVDYVLDYRELHCVIDKIEIKNFNGKVFFDGLYNDYTKIYPVTGGLSKTAHLKGALKIGEEKICDGFLEFENFLKNIDDEKNKKIRFLDANFCRGGCIGGPCLSRELSLEQKKKRLLNYINIAKKEPIPKGREGLVIDAEGIRFRN